MENRKSLPGFFKNTVLGEDFLVKAILAVAFLFAYTFIFSLLMPEGINPVFVLRLSRRLALVLALLNVVFFLRFYRSGRALSRKRVETEPFRATDLCLLLLPMTPVVHYILLNLDIVSGIDFLVLVVFFLALSGALIYLVPFVFRLPGTRKILMALGAAFSFVIFNMASLGADLGWHRWGNLYLQLGILVGVFVLLTAGLYLNRKALSAVLAVFFISGAVNSLFSSPRDIRERYISNEEGQVEMKALARENEIVRRPDIYLLTYESYVENETMLGYGIDNSAQEEYLEEKGFHLYRGAWTVGAASLPGMGGMLGVRRENLDNSRVTRVITAGQGVVQTILSGEGYRTYGIIHSDYFFRGVGSFYDYAFPPAKEVSGSHRLLTQAILEGEFRFDAGFEDIEYDDYLEEKWAFLAADSEKPRFLYTHNFYPGHSQFSGRALGNEVEIFRHGLEKANEEMRRDLELIEKHNPDALVIICGDHGPYLTKNCHWTSLNNDYDMSEINRLDVQDRYGSFLAIRWPENAESVEHGKIEILQDVFPAVFAWLYEDDAFFEWRIEQLSVEPGRVSGVKIRDGFIEGGIDDGKPIYDSAWPD